MDPITTLSSWLNGPERESMINFNAWIARGGFGPAVDILPHTDLFMRGERYGRVVKLGVKYAYVKGNRTGRVFRLTRDAFRVALGA